MLCTQIAWAGAIVITRAEAERSYKGLEQKIRTHNQRAPIMKARVKPECWVDLESGERFPPESLPCSRVAAFCGLANPVSFWRTLDNLGCGTIRRWSFGDHHRYRPIEVRRLGSDALDLGVEALLTTEKDIMNLCEQAGKLVAPTRLLWLKIGMEVEGAEYLFNGAELRRRLV